MHHWERPGYRETMKNITVSVDAAVHHRALIRAAERNTSLSAVVREFLVAFAADESDADQRRRQQNELLARLDAEGRGLEASGQPGNAASARLSLAVAGGCFLDTNVLLHAISSSSEERLKRDRARLLLQEDDWTVSVQVLQEFFVQATRPSRQACLTAGEARQLIES